MRPIIRLKQDRCTGCYTCVVACKDWHDIPPGPISYRRVVATEQGRYPDVRVRFRSVACDHCEDPPCISVCPVGAILKRPDGIVLVDSERCLGRDACGGGCLAACPQGAPQFGAEPHAKMQKCDLCLDRLLAHKGPICVEACPTRALAMDDRDARDAIERG